MASILYVGKQIEGWSLKVIITIIASTLLSYFVTLAEPSHRQIVRFTLLLLCGFIAIIAMILPGVSGAFILLILGAYETAINTVNNLIEGLTKGNFDLLKDALLKFALLGIGAIIGIKVFSKILNWMFKHQKNLTLAILTGFMIGSLNKIWPWKETLKTRINSEGMEVAVLEKSILPSSYIGDSKLLLAIGFVFIGFATISIFGTIGQQKTNGLMQSTRTFSDKLFLVIKGLAMGAANKVPGVSGGVVAFVAGFYEEFIYSLKHVNKNAFKLLIGGRFKSFFRYINGKFLSLLFLGMIVSYFSVSKILDFFLSHYELFVWSLFFGMILGSIYYINKDFKDWNYKSIISLSIGIILGVGISFLNPAKENDNLFFVFFCGIISVSGMTLPGFSGSFILILLGNYVLLLVDSVNSLYDTFAELIIGDFSFVNSAPRIRLLKVLAAFTLG